MRSGGLHGRCDLHEERGRRIAWEIAYPGAQPTAVDLHLLENGHARPDHVDVLNHGSAHSLSGDVNILESRRLDRAQLLHEALVDLMAVGGVIVGAARAVGHAHEEFFVELIADADRRDGHAGALDALNGLERLPPVLYDAVGEHDDPVDRAWGRMLFDEPMRDLQRLGHPRAGSDVHGETLFQKVVELPDAVVRVADPVFFVEEGLSEVGERDHGGSVGRLEAVQKHLDRLDSHRHWLSHNALHLLEGLPAPVDGISLVGFASLHFVTRERYAHPVFALIWRELEVIHCPGRIDDEAEIEDCALPGDRIDFGLEGKQSIEGLVLVTRRGDVWAINGGSHGKPAGHRV